MKIKISDDRKISEIKKEFNDCFPFLKIEFFLKPHIKGAGSEKIFQVINGKATIGECRSIRSMGNIVISPMQTVAQLESEFQKKFGLSVQVFRKSGKIWLQSTVTDDWTLEEQNNHGEALSTF